MKGYPIQLMHLAGARVLVAGAGAVAARKVVELLAVGAEVHVVAPEITDAMVPHLDRLASVSRRAVRPSDVEGAVIVIAASNDVAANRALAEVAKANGVLVNAVDDPDACTFYASAVIRRGPITVAVGSDGQSPLLAGRVRRFIDAVLPKSLASLADVATVARQQGLRGVGRAGRLLSALADPKAAQLIDRGAREAAAERLVEVAQREPEPFEPGTVAIVGAGPGGRGDLTLRALERMHAADVVIHDALVSPEILDEILPSARRIEAGRRCGAHGTTQSATIALIIREAQSGLRVVRLHAGDPGVFGRAGEETEALDSAGVGWMLVPGVSSVLASAASARIPLTQRGVSRGLTIRTGHGRGGYSRSLALDPADETLVVLMGHGGITSIMEGLIDEGRDPATPAAAVSCAGRPNQRVVTGTIATLADRVEELARPVTFIVGEVARRAEDVGALATQVAA